MRACTLVVCRKLSRFLFASVFLFASDLFCVRGASLNRRCIVIAGVSGPATAQEGLMHIREAGADVRSVCMFADGDGLTSKFVGNFMRLVATGAELPSEMVDGLAVTTGYIADYAVAGDGEAGGINGVYRYEEGKPMKKLKAFVSFFALIAQLCRVERWGLRARERARVCARARGGGGGRVGVGGGIQTNASILSNWFSRCCCFLLCLFFFEGHGGTS